MEKDQPRPNDGAPATAIATATPATLSEKRRLPSLDLDVPPPVPPKDNPPASRPGTASTTVSRTTTRSDDQTKPGEPVVTTSLAPTTIHATTPKADHEAAASSKGAAGGRAAPFANIAGTMSTSHPHHGSRPSISTTLSSSFGPPPAPPPARELPTPPPTLASASRPSTRGAADSTPDTTTPEEVKMPPAPVAPLPELPSSNSKWDEVTVTINTALSRARSITSEAGSKLSVSTLTFATRVKEKSRTYTSEWYGAEKDRKEQPMDRPTALMPPPSDDEEDPLVCSPSFLPFFFLPFFFVFFFFPSDNPQNWSPRQKDLTLFALLTALATTTATKTILLPLAQPLASHLAVSPTSVAALTAAPLLFSTLAVHASVVASKLYGKRPVYIASLVVLLCGCAATASAQTSPSYGGFLAARIVQGLGWGACDALPLASIHDLYFEHERRPRLILLDTVTAIATWGSPLLTGVAARDAGADESPAALAVPFQIATAFLALSILFVVLAAPETAFDRWFSGTGTASGSPTPSRRRASSVGTTSTGTTKTMMKTKEIDLGPLWRVEVPVPTRETASHFLNRFNPVSDFRGYRDSRTLLQGPRAVVTPTTVLLALLTFLPTSALWGLTHVASTFFAAPPSEALDPAQVGSLLAAPFVLIVLISVLLSFSDISDRLGISSIVVSTSKLTPRTLFAVMAASTALMMIGTLAFGLETHARASSPDSLSFPLLSILLGFLAVGMYGLGSLVRPLSWRLARNKTANPHVCLRVVADMEAGVGCWRAFFAGVFVLGIANAVERSSGAADMTGGWFIQGTRGLRGAVIGMSVAQVLIAAMVGAVWWFWDERVLRLDGRVLGLVDLSTLKRSASFFEHD